MNGVHDMGGMHGLGPVEREEREPVFHTEWERRAFALTMACGYLGRWNIDMSRYSREDMPAARSLAATYYERWAWGVERLLERVALITRDELDARVRGEPWPVAPAPADAGRVLKPADVERVLRTARDARVDADVPARFKVGAAVLTRNINPVGHTRLPRYARAKRGVIHEDHGVWAFPDARAAGQGPKPQHCYSVRFTARELWGPDASSRDSVYLDVFDDYLDPA